MPETKPDPIFEVLRRYQAIWQKVFDLADEEDALLEARRNPSRRATGLPDGAELEARDKRLTAELRSVEKRLAKTKPTSLAGCVAALDALIVEAEDLNLGGPNWQPAVIENVVAALRSLRA
jgi:hypothetical protein